MYSNRVNLTGFIGQDAEVKNTRNKASYTVLSLATKRSWKDKEGAWQSETNWHKCVSWGKLGEFAASLVKGTHVQIEGELRHRGFVTKNGKSEEVRRSITEVRVTSIVKLDRRQKSGEEAEAAAGAA